MAGNLRIVPTRGGYVVRDDDGYVNLNPHKTKKAALAHLDEVAASRAWLAEQKAADEARAAAWLAERGLAQVDHRKLKPGDTYAAGLYRPLHVVTEAKHFENGVSQVFHDRTRVEELTGDMGFLLLSPSFPVYGILR
jgi:hypothetical protein